MPGPNEPNIASFPVPPPLFNFPWTQPLNGQQILTPQAISFLQLLWAAIQGQGGIIDLNLIGVPQPGTAIVAAQDAVSADYRAIAELGAAKAEIAALRQEIADLAQAVLQRSIWGGGGGAGGTPGGTTGQIQYNNGGVFGGFTMSGDAATNTTTGVLTLATVNANVGTFGDGTHIPQFTVNAKGLITATSNIAITVPVGANPTAQVSGSAVNGTALTFMRSDAAPTLANTPVTAGSYTNANITVDAQGRLTAASTGSGGSGTVTSVAMTVPTSVLTVAGSPITTSGTLAVTLATQTANTIFAGPTTGSAAAPTFRAMVTADIPNSIVTEAKLLLANNTTANVSITAHGFAPILPNDATKFLDGTGAYSVPPSALPSIAAGHVIANSTGSTATAADTTVTALLDRAFGSTQGNILVRGASNWIALAAGTSGNALVSNGAGTTPSYQSVGAGAGGALTLLESHTASSSATLVFTAFQASSYDEYEIHFINIIPATNNVNLVMRFSTDGGATYDSGANYTNNFLVWLVNTPASSYTTGQTSSLLQQSIATLANYGFNANYRLINTAAGYKGLIGNGIGMDGSSGNRPIGWNVANWWLNTAITNGLQFFMSSGNIASGTIRIYGVSH